MHRFETDGKENQGWFQFIEKVADEIQV